MAHKIKPTKESTIKDLVASGKYDWFNSGIEEFPFEAPVAKEIELVHLNRLISSEDAIKELDAQGFRPATATELLLLGAQHPKLQRKDYIVALGTVLQVLGNRHVPYLIGDVSLRFLNLHWWFGGWRGRWRFAAVRKDTQALETGKLGTKKSLDPLDGLILEANGNKYQIKKI